MENRILFVSAYGLFPILEFELAIMADLSNTDKIFYSRCIGMQTRCSANTHNSRILKELKCLKCTSRVDAGLKALDTIKKIDVIDRNFENHSKHSPPPQSREIIEFSAYSNAMTDLESSEKPPSNLFNEYHEISLNSLSHYIYLIEKFNINKVYIYNGRLAEYAPLVWFCKFKNINFNTYEYPLYGNTNFTFCERGNVSDINFLSRQFKSMISNTIEEINEGSEFYSKRINRLHNDLSTQFLMAQEKGNISSVNELKNKRKIISIFTSNEIEYCGVQEISTKRFYKTQSELIDQIIKKIDKNYTLIIRVHPNAKHDKYHAKSINQICNQHNNSVILFDYDSKVDSYELINKSSLVICFGSTIGIESMFLKRPSICIGPSLYSNFINSSNNILSYENFTKFLDDIESQIKHLSTEESIAQNYISACQYAYAWKNSGVNSIYIRSKSYGKIQFKAVNSYINFKSSLISRILYKILKGVSND